MSETSIGEEDDQLLGDVQLPDVPVGVPAESCKTVQYTASLFRPLWTVDATDGPVTCKWSTVQALQAVFVTRQLAKMSDQATNMMLSLIASILPPGNEFPRTLYSAKQQLGIRKFQQNWAACQLGCSAWQVGMAGLDPDTRCSHCGGSPFTSNGSVGWPFLYFPIEHIIDHVLFRDPDFVTAFLQTNLNSQSVGWSDWRAWPLHAKLRDRLNVDDRKWWDHWSSGFYQVGGDGASIFQFTNHSTFLGMVGAQSPCICRALSHA